MKTNIQLLVIFITILFVSHAAGHDKVVVVPLSTKPTAQYIVTARGTITDTVTELMWQQADDGIRRNLTDANIYCANLDLGGYSDWRMPTKDELKSLVVCSNGTDTPLPDNTECGSGSDSPTIDVLFSCHPDWYISSTEDVGSEVWGVRFFNGYANNYPNTYADYARCVR